MTDQARPSAPDIVERLQHFHEWFRTERTFAPEGWQDIALEAKAEIERLRRFVDGTIAKTAERNRRSPPADVAGGREGGVPSGRVSTSDDQSTLGALVGKAALRFAIYWERIQRRPDDDESLEMMRMCQQRDGLIVAIRSLDVSKINAALDESAIVGAQKEDHPK